MRLTKNTLAQAQNCQHPLYDRSRVTPGILHLGIGNFHRAHQAVHVDDSLIQDASWGIIGASLRKSDMHDALAPQDGLYTLAARDAAGVNARIIGSVIGLMHSASGTAGILAAMADPAIRIVSLTVTEKGYCHDPATRNLDAAHPTIRSDLEGLGAPASVPGLIVAALAARRANGFAPFTVLCCDNLPTNGPTVRRIVSQMAALKDDRLAGWIEMHGAFPSTMVDRIVPATTDADRVEIQALTGLQDAWPVMTEPFSQWVVEDQFAAGRPSFPGAEFVSDVTPSEHMKLRMLNGAHSCIAWLGQLAGCQTVSDAMEEPAIAEFIDGLWRVEVMPTLTMPRQALDVYAAALFSRFRNPALKHRTAQIAMDSSQKLPQRLLGTLRDLRAKGLAHRRISTAIVGWIACASDRHGSSAPDDPLRADLAAMAQSGEGGLTGFASHVLSLETVFGDLSSDADFKKEVIDAASLLAAQGWRAVINRAIE